MGIYIKNFPGVRVRIGRRRWSVGPRLSRYHTGAGGRGVSTGAGPVSWYRPLRSRRRRR